MKRLDIYLVEHQLTTSRAQAQDRIKNGLVNVNGVCVTKPSFPTAQDAIVVCAPEEYAFVSRAGYKLHHALIQFRIDIKDKIVLDIGSSTGGFTDVCLQAGATHVYALDSGNDQLVDVIKSNPKVTSMENTNARYLTKDMFPQQIDFVCMDVSFISLSLICDSLFPILTPPYECVFLIKPQFEAGKAFLGKNGIVRDKRVHKRILDQYITYFSDMNMKVLHIEKAAMVGRDGNQEYLIHISSEGSHRWIDTRKIVNERDDVCD